MGEKEPFLQKLDIIVTHYKETWEEVEKFFSMLDIQRGISFSDFRVILVNDGEEYAFPEEYFLDRPYHVDQISIAHAGVSEARNEGLRNADADWVMFCDCDDMFSNPYAMLDIINVLPANEADILWGDIWMESRRSGNGTFIMKKEFNAVFIHGKLFRRKYLLDNNILFDKNIGYCEDSLFVTTAFILCKENRQGRIRTQMPIYVWCDTDGSVTNTNRTKDIAPRCMLYRDKKVCELYRTERSHDEYCAMIARTVIDAYHYLNRTFPLSDELEALRGDFYSWYMEHKKEYESVPYETLKKVKESSRKSAFINPGTLKESVSVTKWLKTLEKDMQEDI